MRTWPTPSQFKREESRVASIRQKTDRDKERDKVLVTSSFTTLPQGDGEMAASTLLILIEGVVRWPLPFLAEEKR